MCHHCDRQILSNNFENADDVQLLLHSQTANPSQTAKIQSKVSRAKYLHSGYLLVIAANTIHILNKD